MRQPLVVECAGLPEGGCLSDRMISLNVWQRDRYPACQCQVCHRLLCMECSSQGKTCPWCDPEWGKQ